MLSTAQAKAIGPTGQTTNVRILLDSASQSNFISEIAAKLLNLEFRPANMQVAGINQSMSLIKHQTDVSILSKTSHFQTKVNCFILSQITCNIPSVSISLDQFHVPHNIQLADPKFNQSDTIDMLLGSNLFWQLLCVGQIKADNGVIYHKTKLGWVVTGEINAPSTKAITCLSIDSLNFDLQKF